MTLDEILIDLYLQIHTADDARDLVDEIMWREINAHVAAEREACAKVLDEMADEAEADMEPSALVTYYREKAAAIRARGTKKSAGD